MGRSSEPRRHRVGGRLCFCCAHHHARVSGHPVRRPLSFLARHRRRQPQRADRRVDQSRAGRARHGRHSGSTRGVSGLGLRVRRHLFGVGLLSDIRSVAAPKGGIALFFGTFNPFHNTHLAILRRAIEERGLEKVIIHPTLVPRIHADAFRKGELRVGRLENGFQILEKTEKGRRRRRLLPDRQQVPAARDTQGPDRACRCRGRHAGQGRGRGSIPKSTIAGASRA